MQSRRRRELGCGLICLIALLFTSCQSPETGATRSRAARRSPAQPPHLDSVVRVFEGKGARETTLWKMLDRLAEAEVVFLGETHVDETTHRVEAAVLEGLIARRDGRVVLAMEMFERDVQPIIDRYLAGEIDEAEFLKSSRPWRNYRTGYRPLIEAAKRQGLPVVAANIPASLRRKIGRGGKEAFEGLTDEERGWAPAELHLSGDPYWKRFERVVRGHLSGMFGGDLEKLVYSGQSLWDNTMGESCALALERHPGRLLLHVNGGFHTGYRQGTVEQLLARRPGTRVRTITVVPVKDLAGIDPEPEDERADYVIYAAERARGVSEGTYAVTAPRELRYRLSPPGEPGSASHGRGRWGAPAPLLVWLPAEGVRPRDAQERWRTALAGEVAVAVVEPPYPQVEEDLHLGGRWYWEESFFEDIGSTELGLERLCGYLLRHFPVDRQRVVIAGAGSGATVAAALAFYNRDLEGRVVAVAPRGYEKLHEGALPAPPKKPGPHLRLEVHAEAASEEWWRSEVDEHRAVGLDGEVFALPEEPGDAAWRIENRVREALGLDPRSLEDALAAGGRTILVLEESSPLARQWATLVGRERERGGGVVSVATMEELPALLARAAASAPTTVKQLRFEPGGGPRELAAEPFRVEAGWRAADLADGVALPLAPGPFGGTTVLVVPEGVSDEEKAAWRELEAENVIKKRSRFANLKVAFSDGERTLPEVLGEIRSAGRSVTLIVPARFCASAEEMRSLRARTDGHRQGLRISWLPGLGGRLHLLEGDE